MIGENREIMIRNIETLCMQQRISYRKLAIKAKISDTAIYNILRGVEKPRKYTIRKIADALNVSVEELISFKFYKEHEDKVCKEQIHYEYIGENIRLICEQRKCGVGMLALKTGLMPMTIRSVMQGKATPRRHTINLIADALKTTPEDLMIRRTI